MVQGLVSQISAQKMRMPEIRDSGFGIRDSGFGIRVWLSGSGFEDLALGFGYWGLDSDFGIGDSDFGFRVQTPLFASVVVE